MREGERERERERERRGICDWYRPSLLIHQVEEKKLSFDRQCFVDGIYRSLISAI